MTKLWTNVARYGDPNGIPKSVLPRSDTGYEKAWDREFTGGREQRLMIWNAAEQQHAVAYALKPYTSMQTFSGCKVSPHSSEALHVQLNFTGVPAPRRQAAIAVMNWVLRGGQVANSSHGVQGDDQRLSHPTPGEERYVDMQRGATTLSMGTADI